jgi:hypothetical protein
MDARGRKTLIRQISHAHPETSACCPRATGSRRAPTLQRGDPDGKVQDERSHGSALLRGRDARRRATMVADAFRQPVFEHFNHPTLTYDIGATWQRRRCDHEPGFRSLPSARIRAMIRVCKEESFTSGLRHHDQTRRERLSRRRWRRMR